jgi:subtilisin family serine protease
MAMELTYRAQSVARPLVFQRRPLLLPLKSPMPMVMGKSPVSLQVLTLVSILPSTLIYLPQELQEPPMPSNLTTVPPAASDATSKGAELQSVINLSIATAYSASLNAAVASAVDAGLTVVVAAGNEDQLAVNDSPASTPSALTVGAIDDEDNRASFSNYGSLVDLFAPGVGILSAWIGSTTATQVMDGTSMACPHVAGLVAYLIALDGPSSPAQITECLLARASSGYVVGAGEGSPNLIAYNGNGA